MTETVARGSRIINKIQPPRSLAHAMTDAVSTGSVRYRAAVEESFLPGGGQAAFRGSPGVPGARQVQEVIVRAIGKGIPWWQALLSQGVLTPVGFRPQGVGGQAAEGRGIRCRSRRRWQGREERYGYNRR